MASVKGTHCMVSCGYSALRPGCGSQALAAGATWRPRHLALQLTSPIVERWNVASGSDGVTIFELTISPHLVHLQHSSHPVLSWIVALLGCMLVQSGGVLLHWQPCDQAFMGPEV